MDNYTDINRTVAVIESALTSTAAECAAWNAVADEYAKAIGVTPTERTPEGYRRALQDAQTRGLQGWGMGK